jgi:ribose 5-phosphate isomerase A
VPINLYQSLRYTIFRPIIKIIVLFRRINLNITDEKRIAAQKAVGFIESEMIVGLGTGSTVKFMVEGLAEKVKSGLAVTTVSTSVDTSKLAESLGITVTNLSDVNRINLTIDGVDEVDAKLNGIKGGGGALLYEKIVASSSERNIWIVDSTKYVEQLGKFPIPVEVVPFGAGHTFNKLAALGYTPKFRLNKGQNYVTDGKNQIIDLHPGMIKDPIKLNDELLLIPGIIETGLFINICDILIIGMENDCKVISKK